MMSVILFVLAVISLSYADNGDYEAVYPYYKLVEEAVTEDPKNLYLLRQIFLPVLKAQPWLIDDVHSIRLQVLVDYHNNQTGMSFEVSWEFRWCKSSLLSLISPDELVAFDPVFFTSIYSSLIHSKESDSLRLPIQLNDNSSSTAMSMTETKNMVKKAVMLFFSWGKTYAKSNGVPTLWDEKDQGYIGEWYSYFAIGSPFMLQSNHQVYFNNTHLGFLLIFIFLNLLLPVLLLTNSDKWNKALRKVFTIQSRSTKATQVLWVAGATLTLANTLYLTAAILMHLKGYPSALRCFIHTKNGCTVPKSEYKSTFTMEALISKAIVFLVAIAVELIAAILLARNLNIPPPPLFTSRKYHFYKLTCCLKIFHFWQIYIFIQIQIGLVGIPLTIMLFISPAQVTIFFITLTAFLLSLAVLLGYIVGTKWHGFIHCFKMTCKWGISFLGTLLIIATLSAIITQYYFLISSGLSMKGVKGYILSLLPPVLLSIFAWILKRKVMKKHLLNDEEQENMKHNESYSDIEPLMSTDLPVIA